MAVAQVAFSLIVEGKQDKAKKLLRKLDSETNEKSLPYGMTSTRGGNQDNRIASEVLRACYAAGDFELAKKIAKSISTDVNQQLSYYNSLGPKMSDNKFIENVEAAFNQKPTIFSQEDYEKDYPQQMSLLQDAATAIDVKNRLQKMAADAGVK
jgi:thioredoxin-like negative regulator of GroEL